MADKVITVSVSWIDLQDAIDILRDAGMPLSPNHWTASPGHVDMGELTERSHPALHVEAGRGQ